MSESDNSFWCGNSSDWAHEKMGEVKKERSPLNKKGWQKKPNANRIVRVKYWGHGEGQLPMYKGQF